MTNKSNKTKVLKLTPKQRKFVNGVVENSSKIGKTKTLGDITREAGYSEATAIKPIQIMESPAVKAELENYLLELDKKRKMALDYLNERKMEKSAGRDLVYINDILTKNHQLLGGGATERIQISDEDKKAVDDAFNQ